MNQGPRISMHDVSVHKSSRLLVFQKYHVKSFFELSKLLESCLRNVCKNKRCINIHFQQVETSLKNIFCYFF